MSKSFYLALCLLCCFGYSNQVVAQKTIGSSKAEVHDHDHDHHSHDLHDQNIIVPATRNCATMDNFQRNLDEHPGMAQYLQEEQERYERFLANPGMRTAGVVTIPVVFHVIYSSNPNLVPDSRLQSQIDVLNEDFGRTNSDAGNTPAAFQGIAANTEIQFCLATQDPNGAATTGINRVQGPSNHNPNNPNQVKSLIQWDPYNYLNVWVVENMGGVLGYATLPGNLPFNPSQDGVVLAQAFTGRNSPGAPYNLGRTGTHEVGHWLGLFHTFQGGCVGLTQNTCTSQGDRICDTPPTASSNGGCPSINQNTCNETYPSNQNDMHMNYMDYVNDACMNLFTQGQSDLMNFFLTSTRADILTSQGCAGSGGPVAQCPGTDTVNFPVTGTPTVYGAGQGQWGYVSGHNSYGDAAKAEYYANTQNYSSVSGMRLQFAVAAAGSNNSSFDAKIWDESGGEPGQILHTETILINDVINAGGDITVMFANPVTVSGAFFVGFDVDYTNTGDTLALVTNTVGDVTTNTAWEQFSNGDWFPYDDQSSWQTALSNAAHPVIEGLSVDITPQAPSIPNGGQIQLITNASVNNVTYDWTPTTGLSCNNCANPVASPTTTTTYTLTATDVAANCTTVTTVTVTVGTVGIENDLFQEEVQAYPNPSNGTFMLAFQSAEINDLDIAIYNHLGQVVYREQLDDFTGDYEKGLNLDRLAKGVYHLRITNGAKAHYKKLIFE